jgi:hypothetical protein
MTNYTTQTNTKGFAHKQNITFICKILILPEPDILQETMIGHYESLGIFSFCFFGSTTAELT